MLLGKRTFWVFSLSISTNKVWIWKTIHCVPPTEYAHSKTSYWTYNELNLTILLFWTELSKWYDHFCDCKFLLTKNMAISLKMIFLSTNTSLKFESKKPFVHMWHIIMWLTTAHFVCRFPVKGILTDYIKRVLLKCSKF